VYFVGTYDQNKAITSLRSRCESECNPRVAATRRDFLLANLSLRQQTHGRYKNGQQDAHSTPYRPGEGAAVVANGNEFRNTAARYFETHHSATNLAGAHALVPNGMIRTPQSRTGQISVIPKDGKLIDVVGGMLWGDFSDYAPFSCSRVF
jgi:hypothetical protein